MFQDIEERVAAALAERLQSRYSLDVRVVFEQPKQSAFGELSVPIAFQLARQLKRPPRQVAQDLVEGLHVPGVAAFEVAGNGYINIRLNRAQYSRELLTSARAAEASTNDGRKIVVEHTNINPNKAAHIGHLRNAILGDTFVRMLRDRGELVEVQNYIDNTGVQVADVVVAFHYLERKTAEDVRALLSDPAVRFDYVCWDLYARMSTYYGEHPESQSWRAETLHAIEAGASEVAELAHVVADAIVRAHVATMYRLQIEYDVLPRESEILHLQFWATAFELLKQRGAIYFEESGKNKGCWVMPSHAFRQQADAGGGDAEEESKDDSKVIVRSNRTVTYVGKDIAYQLWKFGLLGKDFFYRPWSAYPDGRELWVTTDQPIGGRTPAFGKASEVYNVIDSRQSYLQDVVVAGLRALGFNKQADASVHFSYEMVALSPRTCLEMGIELSDEDKRRPYVEVSGRKGLGVKADDLIDKLIATAQAEVDNRNADRDPQERRRVAEQIAIGALRYFMLKFTRNSVIAFDFHEALSFQGETGPYVQYAIVRANKILQEFALRVGSVPEFAEVLTEEVLGQELETEELWQFVVLASRSGHAVQSAIAAGEPAHVAKYAFELAQSFSNFYHKYRVLQEPDAHRRNVLLWLTSFLRDQLSATVRVLGIDVPIYM